MGLNIRRNGKLYALPDTAAAQQAYLTRLTSASARVNHCIRIDAEM